MDCCLSLTQLDGRLHAPRSQGFFLVLPCRCPDSSKHRLVPNPAPMPPSQRLFPHKLHPFFFFPVSNPPRVLLSLLKFLYWSSFSLQGIPAFFPVAAGVCMFLDVFCLKRHEPHPSTGLIFPSDLETGFWHFRRCFFVFAYYSVTLLFFCFVY